MKQNVSYNDNVVTVLYDTERTGLDSVAVGQIMSAREVGVARAAQTGRLISEAGAPIWRLRDGPNENPNLSLVPRTFVGILGS